MVEWHPLCFSLINFEDWVQWLSAHVTLEEIGTSGLGRPIYRYRVGRGDLRLLIIAGIHGTEPAPVHAASLLAPLLTERYPLNFEINGLHQLELHVIPLANPDGFAKNFFYFSQRDFQPHWAHVWEDARFTANGNDINRDWMRLALPETRALHRAFNEINPHVVLDLHEFYARGGCPPRWADETEGFLATITDAPYKQVNKEIKIVSAELAQAIANRIDWHPKLRHFSGGATSELLAPPTCLGSHLPYEGVAKVLVETWGVGLGPYLLPDRIMVQIEAILATIEFMEQHKTELIRMRKEWELEEEELGRDRNGFRVRGAELLEAAELLQLHGIKIERKDNEIFVPMPQRRSQMALMLLDRECEFNKGLASQHQGIYTIDRLLRVEIEVA
jgi:hypothetical protein